MELQFLKSQINPHFLFNTEITYLRHMISLQELRYDGKTYIEFSSKGNLKDFSIAPLLLISFVENAFKQGDVMDPNIPLRIAIKLENGVLHFNLTNKISYKNKDLIGGIGLQNVKRRLDLMYHNLHN